MRTPEDFRASATGTSWMLEFYLTGIESEASDALNRAERLVDLRENYRQRITSSTRGQVIGVLDYLFANPIVTARTIENQLGVARPTALRILDRLTELEILSESTPGPRRVRRFVATEILAAIEGD